MVTGTYSTGLDDDAVVTPSTTGGWNILQGVVKPRWAQVGPGGSRSSRARFISKVKLTRINSPSVQVNSLEFDWLKFQVHFS